MHGARELENADVAAAPHILGALTKTTEGDATVCTFCAVKLPVGQGYSLKAGGDCSTLGAKCTQVKPLVPLFLRNTFIACSQDCPSLSPVFTPVLATTRVRNVVKSAAFSEFQTFA